MNRDQRVTAIYSCPMHSDIRRGYPDDCPECGKRMLPEGRKFARVRYVVEDPELLAMIAIGTAGLMTAVTMLLHR
jgi:hypothetical protein